MTPNNDSPNSNTIVLVPHYNNVQGLMNSLRSIKHSNSIDVLVVDDGSDNNQLPNIPEINNILNKNVNVKIIEISLNGGITNALNVGLDYILKKKTHRFVARLDCGDVCVANRFSIQEKFLLNNNSIDIVGSWVKWVDNKSKKDIFCYKPPTNHKKIRRMMAVRCNIIHPSVMYRLSVVEALGKYPLNFEAAEDYAYFFNMANRSQTANIAKFLTKVEYNPKGISYAKRKEQNKSKLKIVLKYGKFNFHTVYGIAYNIGLMAVPSKIVLKMKKQLFKAP